MSEIVTLELPDVLVQSARSVATQTHRRVEDVLLEWLDRAATEVPVESLPDDQVLILSDMQMTETQQTELSELLAQQREGNLDHDRRMRLDALMAIYRRGLVRKARAINTAIARGLRPPLS